METQKTTTVINNLTKDVQTISNNTPPRNTYCRRVGKKHFFGIHSLINNLHNVLFGAVL